jgi:Tfp pilus assembly protein PilV
MKKLLNSEKGWLLVDSIMGMLILTIAILALSATYIMSSKSNVYSKNYGQALAVYQDYAEKHKVDSATFEVESRVEPNGIFVITPTVDVATNDDLSTDITPVKIAVSWHDQNGNHRIEMVNYYYSSQVIK